MLSKIISNIIFLPVILFIGCITSYEDFKISKIRNKWISMGLLYALTVYLVSWILYSLAEGPSSYLVCNFDKWCINLVISTVVAYLLWHFKMWGAGDAKLFICYSALIPMGQYSRIYFNYYFASFLLLLAVFIPATAFLFIRSTAYLIKKIAFGINQKQFSSSATRRTRTILTKRRISKWYSVYTFLYHKRFKFSEIKQKIPKAIKERLAKFNRIETAKVIFGFFVFFLSFRILRQEFQNLVYKVLPGQNSIMLIPLLAFRQLSKIFKKNLKFTAVVFVFLMAYLIFKMLYSWERFIFEMGNTLMWVIFIMVLFPIVKKIIDLYAERTAQKTTPFAHWMFLGALIVWFI